MPLIEVTIKSSEFSNSNPNEAKSRASSGKTKTCPKCKKELTYAMARYAAEMSCEIHFLPKPHSEKQIAEDIISPILLFCPECGERIH